jgi:putative DNA primase/helicase
MKKSIILKEDIKQQISEIGTEKEEFDKASAFTAEESAKIHEEYINKAKWARTLGYLKITNYIQNVESFWKQYPFFYDKHKLWWKWNYLANKYENVDEIDMMNGIDDALQFGGETVTSGIKANYLEAFKRVGRKKIPKEAPVKWVQFKDKAFSLKSGKIYNVEPNYFFTNPIPWELGTSEDTPIIDKLLNEWVGEKYVKTLYELIAYCCYRKYPIQTLFCLQGIGRNGKTCFINLLTKFLGVDNICSAELDDIAGNKSNRFATFKLYTKLACQMGETNFGLLSSSAVLKKLTGGDLIGFEKKRADPFDDYNYAKIIISSNALPSSLDTSEGFYRRWIIIHFPNQFKEGKDILKIIPVSEFNNLALKITKILPELLKKGEFTNQGSIEERKINYIMASNPLPLFINECCDRNEGSFITYDELYTYYILFLKALKKRRVLRKEFKASLEDEGLFVEKCNKKLDDDTGIWKSTYWVDGIQIKDNFNDICDNFHKSPTSFLMYSFKVKTMSQNAQKSQKLEVKEENIA